MFITTSDRSDVYHYLRQERCSSLPQTGAELKHQGEDVDDYLRQDQNESIVERILTLPQARSQLKHHGKDVNHYLRQEWNNMEELFTTT